MFNVNVVRLALVSDMILDCGIVIDPCDEFQCEQGQPGGDVGVTQGNIVGEG